jgi:hypothetical protein
MPQQSGRGRGVRGFWIGLETLHMRVEGRCRVPPHGARVMSRYDEDEDDDAGARSKYSSWQHLWMYRTCQTISDTLFYLYQLACAHPPPVQQDHQGMRSNKKMEMHSQAESCAVHPSCIGP